MVMTTCAIDSQPEKCLSHHAHQILHLILSHGLAHGVVGGACSVMRAGDQAAEGDDAVRRARLDHVARNLHFHKSVVRQVGV